MNDLDAIRARCDEVHDRQVGSFSDHVLRSPLTLAETYALLAEVERLKAHQPDGGEWRTWYGADTDDEGGFSLERYRWDTHQFRTWTGPIGQIPAESESKPSDTPPESTTDQTTPNGA